MKHSAKNQIILKRATHRNFMSYGNDVNEFTFPEGLNWLSASNGCGKSTEVEVLNFAFFGKSYRGGKRDDLRNTMNTEATLEVSVEFTRRQGETEEEYYITRTLDPKGNMKFTVERKEGDKWVAQNKRAGFTQKDFEEDILHFNEVLFKNIVAMNTQESIPFIDMEAADRRKLTDSIIMLDNDRVKKENAKELSNAKTNYEIAASDRTRIEGEIANLNNIIAQMKEEKKANIAQMEANLADKKTQMEGYVNQSSTIKPVLEGLQQKLGELKSVIDTEPGIDQALARIANARTQVAPLQQYRQELEAAQAEYDKANQEYAALPVNEKQAEMNGCDAEIPKLSSARGTKDGLARNLDFQIQQLEKQMAEVVEQGKNMKPGVPCPTCGKLSTPEDVEPHKAELRKKWVNMNTTVNKMKTELEGVRANVAELDEQIAAVNAKRQAIFNEIQGYNQIYAERVVPAKTKVSQIQQSIANSERIIAAAGIDVDRFVTEETRLNGEKAKIAEVRGEWQTTYDSYSEKNGEYSTLMGYIQQSQAEISRLDNEINRIKTATSEDALSMTMKRLEEAEADLENATERWHDASDTIAACNYITGMLSDNGMKKMVYSLYIDHFNEVVRKNLLRANLPFVIEFDETMNFKFISSPGYAPTYIMLSQGQRRKVGFAIAMAFRDFVSLVGNFSVNFLSLDEVLDISTDNYAMREMLDIVRSMVDDIGCVVVITHRGDVVADKFDHKITVEYDGTYSHMGSVENV